MNATKYAAVLETKLLASARSLFLDEYWIFQGDNAPCHRAKLVKRWIQSQRVAQMQWRLAHRSCRAAAPPKKSKLGLAPN